MMTQIIDHGRWVPYVPSRWPEYAPPNTIFARRESDGVDWYEYRNGANFGTDTVKFVAWWQDAYNGYVIGAATRDLNQFPCPLGMLVREIIDYHGGDPQTELGDRLYDPDTHRLHPLPELPMPPYFIKLEARLAAIEAKLGIAP
jgi:hypothetical protein